MARIINEHNLTSVINQSGGFLSSGYKLHKSVVDLKLKKTNYLKHFNKQKGGNIRGGSEVRSYNGGQKGGNIRGGSEVRSYNGGQKGGTKSKKSKKNARRYGKNKTHNKRAKTI
jgi:hypothetical protein